jgi:Na+/proline symporter
MHWIDWLVMFVVLATIVAYGIWKTRSVKTARSYLRGDKELNWWTIGFSVMATQASAITFLSTPGQGYDDGMRFVQFYFGMPLAMIVICIFILPIYYRLNVYTAYEYLEQRFDSKTRTLAAVLFLFSRGMAAGFTISAPSIILNNIMGWNLHTIIVLLGCAVTFYTVMGGTKAVSFTQKQQMTVMLTGLILAAILIVFKLPADVSFFDAVGLATEMGKLEAVDTKFDLANRYNIWSGFIASFFLFMSYFGTDQSQVQRYLSGRSLRESSIGLLFNGFIKVPMQYLVLFTGVMVFVFFQFVQPPVHFNRENLSRLEQAAAYQPQLEGLKQQYDANFQQKQSEVTNLIDAIRQQDHPAIDQAKAKVQALNQQDKDLRAQVDDLLEQHAGQSGKPVETNDRDYVFITFVINYLPVGIVGLLLAVIFCAAMSSIASELTALSTTTVVDIYRHSFVKEETDEHYLRVSKMLTLIWGGLVIVFATIASLFENLIQAVNIVGSLLYGTILGIFLVAFFFKKITATPVFIAAMVAEAVVIAVYFLDKADGVEDIGFLWLNPIGCAVVMGVSAVLQILLRSGKQGLRGGKL